MPNKSLLIVPAIALAAVSGLAEARSKAIVGDSQARSNLNTRSDGYGYLPSRRSFYGYPRHRHVDGGSEGSSSFGRFPYDRYDASPNYDGNYGSLYYGTNYGAPYYRGGYYDDGIYYRERRD